MQKDGIRPMTTKRCFHCYRTGDLSGLEKALDAMSAAGWQPVKPGRFLQRFRREDGAFVHRLDYCPDRSGSAGEIRFLAARERAGWQPAARKKGWILFRKPAAAAEPEEKLPEHRASVQALFRRRIARLESLRRWLLVPAALMLLGGYAADLPWLLYASALPLAVALAVTYRIKFMEEGLRE